jgi:hypothetical protein
LVRNLINPRFRFIDVHLFKYLLYFHTERNYKFPKHAEFHPHTLSPILLGGQGQAVISDSSLQNPSKEYREKRTKDTFGACTRRCTKVVLNLLHHIIKLYRIHHTQELSE